MRQTKRDIYAAYGIEYKTKGSKIYCDPLNQWIKPVLKNGNDKIGRGVWHFSITAGQKAVSDEIAQQVIQNVQDQWIDTDQNMIRIMCGGTCHCSCPGCYAQLGHYARKSVGLCLARHTFLVWTALDWLERAIMAQLAADHIEYCRIHVAGDFLNLDYLKMWIRVCESNPGCCFWTYTKQDKIQPHVVQDLKKLDSLKNCNIVKSFVEEGKINFGHAGYIMNLYRDLQARGESVWICKCGIDPNQHCNGCHHCFTSHYVLFLEHSTDYDPTKDPDFPAFCDLVAGQYDEDQQPAA